MRAARVPPASSDVEIRDSQVPGRAGTRTSAYPVQKTFFVAFRRRREECPKCDVVAYSADRRMSSAQDRECAIDSAPQPVLLDVMI